MIAQFAMAALWLLRKLPADKALDFAARTARAIGPRFGRHRTAVDNLRRAYPEKSPAEIEAIAMEMWDNMARLAAEYVFLDQLFDFDPNDRSSGRIEIAGEDLFIRLAAENKPHILFTAHLGNFELLPIAAAVHGLKITALFRPPNNPYIADYVLSARRSNMGELLETRTGAAFALAGILERGGNVGALVDQKFSGGVETTFFGRPCETNPVLPMLARRFECPVHPARCIRLPGNRYRLEIMDELELPRDASGEIDVQASAQLLNDVVEGWVRESPGQWMWFHKRWSLNPRRRKKRKANKAH
jgi:KDO2-lipid IV(A) lauroyltransferase